MLKTKKIQKATANVSCNFSALCWQLRGSARPRLWKMVKRSQPLLSNPPQSCLFQSLQGDICFLKQP